MRDAAGRGDGPKFGIRMTAGDGFKFGMRLAAGDGSENHVSAQCGQNTPEGDAFDGISFRLFCFAMKSHKFFGIFCWNLL